MQQNYSPFHPPANFWAKSWKPLAQLIANGLLKSFVVIASYYWVKNLSFQIRQDGQVEAQNIIYLFLAAALIVLLRLHERYIAEKMSQKYINSIRSSLLKRLMRSSVRDIQKKTIGNLSSRLAGDLSSVKRWLSLGISRLVTHSILLIITMALIIQINSFMGLVIGAAIVLLIALAMFVGSQLKEIIKQVRKNRIRIHSLLVERLSSLSMIRTMGKEQKEVSKINAVANKLEKNSARQGVFLGLLRGIGDSSALLLIGLFFLLNGFKGHFLSTDEITALISIILFLNSPIRELGRVQEYYQGAKISLNKIQELYAIPRIVRGKSKLRNVKEGEKDLGRITFREVTLSPVFNRLRLTANKGDYIALTGKNGAGKSTLIQLILGLIKQDSGRIRVNGIYPNKTMAHDRAQHIGCSGATMGLLNATLKTNLNYRNSSTSKIEFKNLLRFCQLDRLIDNMDKGLNTMVNEQGQNFSSGEKARISLFRALLGNPEILILDEPESFLDKKGFEIIKKLLSSYTGTIIIATHHQELISLCHKEWNLDGIQAKNNKTMRIIKNHVEK